MFRLVYLSSAVKLFSKDELLDLLSKAREKNARLGITGMLLYKGGDFLQLLEGKEGLVRDMLETIRQDARHKGVIVLFEEQVSARLFEDWPMGFRSITDNEARALTGFSQFMNNGLNADALKNDPSGCLDFLNQFRNFR